MIIGQSYLMRNSIVHAGKMYSPLVHYPRAKGQSLGGIVVAAYDHHFSTGLRQGIYEVVEKPHCLSRWKRFIVYIAGYKNSVWFFLFDLTNDLIKDIALVFYHRKLIDTLSYMQI